MDRSVYILIVNVSGKPIYMNEFLARFKRLYPWSYEIFPSVYAMCTSDDKVSIEMRLEDCALEIHDSIARSIETDQELYRFNLKYDLHLSGWLLMPYCAGTSSVYLDDDDARISLQKLLERADGES